MKNSILTLCLLFFLLTSYAQVRVLPDKVGIGTENPERALHIKGSAGISDEVIFESNSDFSEAGLILAAKVLS